MTPSELRACFRKGQAVFGTLIVSTSPRWPEVVATCGLDFVFIDTEHITLERAHLSAWIARVHPKAFLAASCVRAFLGISENPALDLNRIGSGRVRSEYGNRIRSARRSP